VGGLLESRRAAESAIRARTRENLAGVRGLVPGTPVSVLDVEGGWYATLRVPRTCTELEWAVGLLEEDGVHVHPGHFFDFEGEAYLVVSLLTPEATFREGARRIVDRVTTTSA
ncbi:MAG TPA: pyridoxal phosphate-dependent aminotransferase, partial [Polyangiaceae bacterium]|nr:pyridoxal phosphate-dependent aminotransferase [Polyangiaceae bacterium]